MRRRTDPELARILQLMARRWRLNSRPTRRAENADSYLWVALDRELRPLVSAQRIAMDWSPLGITPAMIDTIASRARGRPEFQDALRALDTARKLNSAADIVQWHRERLTHLDGLRQHLEALRLLQLARAT